MRSSTTRRLVRAAAVVVTPMLTVLVTGIGPAGATGGAHFAGGAVPALYDYAPEGDGDWRELEDTNADDLMVTFSEVGVGSETIEFTVSTRRVIEATCVSAFGDLDVAEVERVVSAPITGSRDATDKAPATSEDDGRVSGSATIPTLLGEDVCPDWAFDSEEHPDQYAYAYAMTDASVTYTDIVVTDTVNGVTTTAPDAGPFPYDDPMFGASTPAVGLTCTIESAEAGNCHTQ